MKAAASRDVDIRVRKLDLRDPASIPRWWYYGEPGISHAANAISLLFPSGERFFVRSVSYYKDQLTDPELAARVRAFIGQELQHGRAHAQFEQVLEAQGFEIQSFLRAYQWLAWQVIEPLSPPPLRLATTVALEHFTAVLAREALAEGFLDHAHPSMRELLRWHAAEEIEHKSVAFDVFQTVDGRYAVRVAGLAIAVTGLAAFWAAGTRHLLRQETEVTAERLAAERRQARERGQSRSRFLRDGVMSFLRRDFHPDQVDDDRALARAYLASVGRLDG